MQLSVPLAEYRSLLGAYLRPQRGRVVLLAVLLLGGIGLQLLNPQVIRYFLDATQTAGAGDNLLLAGIAFIAIGLGQQLVALATQYTSINVGWSATNALRSRLTDHLLRLDMPFHKTHTPGALIERVDGDVNALANFFAQFVVRVLGNGILIVAVLALLLVEDWRAGLALFVYTLITFFALSRLQGLGTRRYAAARQASAEHFGYIEERLSGTEDIRGSGAEAYTLDRLYPLMSKFAKAEIAARIVSTLGEGVSGFLFVSGYALGLGLGAYLYSQGDITIGAAFLIVYYIGMLQAPIENIRQQASDLQQASASISRVNELFRRQPQVRGASGGDLPAGALAINFDNVSFAYDDAERENAGDEETPPDPEAEIPGLVLRDVSFALPPGRVLGVLGRTGSGKTTTTRLLFRLYDPTRGVVRLGGTDIRAVPLANLRERVGMVTQDVQLFRASIRDNIAFFDPTVSDERIVEVLRALDLWDWVQAMPEGLNTRLAAGGAGMSAGEAQLLAFTRVLLKDPGLVILDEAASRLDPITEQRLERAISRLLAGRSGLIIAHRLHTLGRADDILILEGGRVAEYGPRETLAADTNSRYYRLLQTGLEEALA